MGAQILFQHSELGKLTIEEIRQRLSEIRIPRGLDFEREIGGTVYMVTSRFKPERAESIVQKVCRLVVNDAITQMAASDVGQSESPRSKAAEHFRGYVVTNVPRGGMSTPKMNERDAVAEFSVGTTKEVVDCGKNEADSGDAHA